MAQPPGPNPPPSSGSKPPHPPAREEMLDAVKQVMGEVAVKRQSVVAEKKAEADRARRRRRRGPLLVALGVVALVVTIVVMLPRIRRPYTPPSGAEAERHAREAVAFAARLVEQYRERTGGLPRSLDQLGVALPGVRYAVDRQGYVLTIMADSTPITHRGSAVAATAQPSPGSRPSP